MWACPAALVAAIFGGPEGAIRDGLFGYKGGVILVTGTPFANNPTQYDDFVPGSFTEAEDLDPFTFDVDRFDIE